MRGQIAILYDSILIDQIKKPDLLDSGFDYYKINISAFNYYTIQVENRDGLKKYLAENEVETQVYYPRLITDNLICPSRNNFENARRICDRVLSLPIYPGLKSSEVTEIAGLVNKYVGRSNE
ncbi:MAG: DegT/DnrJ/EryC1/StrS family aminotransferase, partial [Nanoarchaeota archaeon]|nr:DegT/DnrJ/EryC1/StrS family aminotransferase [Nanoarchaeota archaeon]